MRTALRLLVGLLGFAIGCAAAVWLVLWVSLRSSAVRIPSVIGFEPLRAVGALQESGLVARMEEGIFSAEVPVGRVAVQRPAAGFQLKRGSTVLLRPSLGTAALRLADLVGLPIGLAEAQIEADGLTAGPAREVNGEADATVVVATAPAAGVMVAPGSPVALLVNRSPRQRRFVMPDFVGNDEDGASRAIARLGFRLASVQRVDYPGALPGVVLRQDPPAGGPVSEAAVVALWVRR